MKTIGLILGWIGLVLVYSVLFHISAYLGMFIVGCHLLLIARAYLS